MSVVKFKFVGLLRGLFRRPEGDEGVEQEQVTGGQETRPVTAVSTSVAPACEPAPYAPEVAVSAAAPVNPNEIQLPLTPILAALPMELRAKVMPSNTTGTMITVSVDDVLSQLATGSVKITFGDLRYLAPGVFANSGGEHDSKPVNLPLNYILAQLNPVLLARRSAQKRVEVSGDIPSPFDNQGQGLKISNETLKAPPQAPPPPDPVPLSRLAPPPPAPAAAAVPVVPPPSFAPRWKTPTVPPVGQGGGNGHGSGTNGSNGAGHAPANGTNGTNRVAGFEASAEPTPLRMKLPASDSTEKSVLVPLGALLEAWPEVLRAEIEMLDLSHAQVALPANQVEAALKRGRVIFTWRELRSWIQNVAVAVSVHDGAELELPLKVIAPLMFSRQKPAGPPRKVSVAEEIPNLFFGFPQTPEAPAAPVPPAPPTAAASVPAPAAPVVPQPVDTNFFSRNNPTQTSDSEFKRKGGTDFSHRAASPSDIVGRAMKLPGVSGAVIALPDGLKVASQIPTHLNGDTLAAFLPQIFARVNQCSRELRMGDLNNLSFTVGTVPWKIFRVNAVYFAAFGRSNEILPTAPLAQLAAELDRKKQ